MTDGIIQQIISKYKIGTHNYKLNYDVNDFNSMLSKLQQELIENIKQNSITDRDYIGQDSYVTLKKLIGDNEK